MTRADDAVRGYTCPRDRGGCGASPGQRCVRLGANLGTRTLMHPHRVRVAQVARPARGPSDSRLASWVRSHAAELRAALDTWGRHGGEDEGRALARLAELDTMLPPAEAGQ